MMLRAIIVWLAMAAVAIANGTFRVVALNPWLGPAWGHVASSLLLCLLIGILTFATIAWVGPRNRGHAVLVGMLWLALTLGFEFGFGHWVAHKPWSVLLADYNLIRGRIWILVLGVTVTSPYLAARARNRF